MAGVLSSQEIVEFRSLTESLAMPDQCQRLTATAQYDADGQDIAPGWTVAGVYPCAFTWGTDNDRTTEIRGLATATPRMRVPASATFTSRDRVALTHRYGQGLGEPMVFQVAGQPLPGLTSTTLELERVTT